QHADVTAAVVLHDVGHDLVGPLGFDGYVAVRAVLRAQFHVEQPQKMVDFRHRGHGRFAAPAAGALLDGYRGGNAVDGVDVGLAGGLNDGACVGVERFQIAALPFVEQDIEGEGGFARARYARDHGECVTRNADVHALEVVFAGIQDIDAVAPGTASPQDALQRCALAPAFGGASRFGAGTGPGDRLQRVLGHRLGKC